MRDLFLHHTVTPQWTGAAAGRRLQQIARSRGFIDISYSWLVDVRGNEIEGRGWARSGAHTRGYNSTSHAVSLVGNFEAGPMPAAMIRGVVRRCRAHRRYGPGRVTRPHSAVGQTACPGRFARAQIPGINRQAASSTPAPTKDWFDMADRDDLRAVVREETRDIPDLAQIGMKVLEGLIWAAENRPVKVGDTTANAQHQLGLIVHAAVREEISTHSRDELEALIESVVRRVLAEREG